MLIALSLLIFVRSYLQIHELFLHDRKLGYWQAHEAIGGGMFSRIFRYGFGGSWSEPLLQSLRFHLMIAVSIEASLSYLGFGIQEPQASFGNMLSAHFNLFVKGQWYILIVIVIALWLTAKFPSILFAFLIRLRELYLFQNLRTKWLGSREIGLEGTQTSQI